ncbi:MULTISPECIES: TA system antitoxin ParD family protein [Allofrancisella]|uniref:ParD-like antitoxin of type II toxin-antitoxin system n=3 Tax=Allofrancisella TaxID=1869285 RepID=A0A0A8E433_9GAMM|nr:MULTISPECIES: ParD-like family protein [Allofrancisella]KEI35977.1 hypothetical protein FRA_24c00620 [Francisella sp. W12-1067]AJC48699.1 hypothetical protein SD28_03100 [Allofrancisella guangzhouensis]MBK2026953.1 ParD-like family protein [Allofrancisella guangzhouensis]MBK2044234.1 ParD-like family protein [Allofrancisella guangzhouensis]MBK2045159.1 ParD-like family protein [Allofrancisella guangzhouensis]
MALSVRLSDDLVIKAKTIAKVMHRSCASQIEHWAMIGRIVEENPDLPYDFVIGSLVAKAEMDNGLVEDYEFEN